MSWALLNDTNIWRKQLVHRYLQNNIRYFRSKFSPWTEAQAKTIFWASSSTTNQLHLSPPFHAFLDICHFFGHCHLFWTHGLKILRKKWVKIFTKSLKLPGLGVLWVRSNHLEEKNSIYKQTVSAYKCTFFYLFKILLNIITYQCNDV